MVNLCLLFSVGISRFLISQWLIYCCSFSDPNYFLSSNQSSDYGFVIDLHYCTKVLNHPSCLYRFLLMSHTFIYSCNVTLVRISIRLVKVLDFVFSFQSFSAKYLTFIRAFQWSPELQERTSTVWHAADKWGCVILRFYLHPWLELDNCIYCIKRHFSLLYGIKRLIFFSSSAGVIIIF